MDYQDIRLKRRDSIALLTLNRPDIRNVLTGETMIAELVDAVSRVNENEEISVLLLTGAGPAFSAGGNIKDMAARTGMFAGDAEQIAQNYREGIQRIARTFYRLDAPVVCAVNGPAIGAGCDLACMADIRIASDAATFGETFAALGLIPGDGGAFFLPRVVGWSRASELTFTARIIDAHEALAMGLVSEVVAPEKLLTRALALAEDIARKPVKTLRMAKRLLRAARTRSLDDLLDLSAEFQGLCHHLPEHEEALAALVKKKPATDEE